MSHCQIEHGEHRNFMAKCQGSGKQDKYNKWVLIHDTTLSYKLNQLPHTECKELRVPWKDKYVVATSWKPEIRHLTQNLHWTRQGSTKQKQQYASKQPRQLKATEKQQRTLFLNSFPKWVSLFQNSKTKSKLLWELFPCQSIPKIASET